MHFPKQLYQNERKTYGEESIHSLNYMYARHKPHSEWKAGEEYPDFTKIKSDQSFNWSAFSLPVWARFNNQKVYLAEYGVLGYSVYTMRNAHLFDEKVPVTVFGINHKTDPNNYSHCELYEVNNCSKADKRAWRMTLKHRCHKPLLPFQKVTFPIIAFGFPIMWFHRSLINNYIKVVTSPLLLFYHPNSFRFFKKH